MPQPIHSKHQVASFHRHPGHLKTRPAHAAGIGNVTFEWATLEDELIHLFQFCIFATSSDESAGAPVAATALKEIESVTVRLDVIQALLKQHVR